MFVINCDVPKASHRDLTKEGFRQMQFNIILWKSKFFYEVQPKLKFSAFLCPKQLYTGNNLEIISGPCFNLGKNLKNDKLQQNLKLAE